VGSILQEPVYSMEDLKKMFSEMVQSFSPTVEPISCGFDRSHASKRCRRIGNYTETTVQMGMPGFQW
jgi:hypothetical protein